MKFQMQIAGCVRQIETHHAASRMAQPCDARHVKHLTGRVIHSAQHDQCDLISLALDQRLNVFIAQAGLSGRGVNSISEVAGSKP